MKALSIIAKHELKEVLTCCLCTHWTITTPLSICNANGKDGGFEMQVFSEDLDSTSGDVSANDMIIDQVVQESPKYMWIVACNAFSNKHRVCLKSRDVIDPFV